MAMQQESLRLQAIQWVREQCIRYQDVLPRNILEKGFDAGMQQIRLLGPQGIWFPKGWSMPLSITTTFNSPYKDEVWDNGLINYRYRGTDPFHRDNVGLRNAMATQTPLIYFHGFRVSSYTALYPVYIVDEAPRSLSFTVAVDEFSTAFQILQQETDRVGRSVDYNAMLASAAGFVSDDSAISMEGRQQSLFPSPPSLVSMGSSLRQDQGVELRRAYITREMKQRLFQSAFRDIVLHAYEDQCAFCQLRHKELLDAAHIIPDSHVDGKPTVNNGMSLCKIHHAAFDANIVGIRPDHIIQVNEQVLQEVDGPMLKYGIQQMHNKPIILPKGQNEWPDEEKLKVRYEQFIAG
jgi:putative restriction endonuclease